MARVDPRQVRHFRLSPSDRTAQVNSIRVPEGEEEAAKFVREAVKAFPELYFSRFVILGEGASEEVVLPRLAEALELQIDRSFIAIVPLGGRHVNHLWKLLSDLAIPYATLLDLDAGRSGGGWGRIRNTCIQLLENGIEPADLFGTALSPSGPEQNLTAFNNYVMDTSGLEVLKQWVQWLRQFNVYFCWPLDLDYSMLRAFPTDYRKLESGQSGPSEKGNPTTAVLGSEGDPIAYADTPLDDDFRWYRYLFLGRGKPSTHVRVLSTIDTEVLKNNIPEEMKALLTKVTDTVNRVGE